MIGDRIRAERLARGWTREDLARRTAISAGYIKLLERNARPNPTGDTLAALATAFGLTVDELRRPGDGEPPVAPLQAAGATDPELADLLAIWPRIPVRLRPLVLSLIRQTLRLERAAENQEHRANGSEDPVE